MDVVQDGIAERGLQRAPLINVPAPLANDQRQGGTRLDASQVIWKENSLAGAYDRTGELDGDAGGTWIPGRFRAAGGGATKDFAGARDRWEQFHRIK